MRVLLVGSGGREHALAWALARSPRCEALFVAPGNAGTAQVGCNVPIKAEDLDGLVRFAVQQSCGLVVVGPEMPLALGLADRLQAAGVRCFGPVEAAARIEASKAFSKALMRDLGLPTADYATFTDADAAEAHVRAVGAPIVVKASGLAAGKGAIVCQTVDEACAAIDLVGRQRAFGAAGDEIVVEAFLTGNEVSVLAFSDGLTVRPMIQAQDHKAAYDGDRGPNTGGMGCYAPAPLLNEAQLAVVTEQVLQPVVDGLRERGAPYVGVLYAGLMVAGDDLRVLEFNCRFGDPEAQAILPLLENDLLDVLDACVDGRLHEVELRWRRCTTVCVVMASGGYPGAYQRGLPIEGLDRAAALDDVVVFHAGTRLADGQVLTDGGRVLGVTAWAADLRAARERAYAAVDLIEWPGAFARRDIGAKGLREELR
ncbi:MAG: phosphoribosylamine--glycine ligase [Anaerolineae bacterium]|jgi:phosphoribosylamine--glycine ligase